MSVLSKFFTQHTRYDTARVAQLKPIRESIQRLGLPILSIRQLMAILNALEVQLEIGGDSAEVNALLLAALRLGVRQAVGETAAAAVFQAIDQFAEIEDLRWEQVEAGTLPPIELTPDERLDEMMQAGYELMQANQLAAACDRWLAVWELVKQMAGPQMRTAAAFDDAHLGLQQFVSNWCSDLEMELGNAGIGNPIYHEHRIRYAREFLAQFPDSSADTYVNVMRAQGEAQWWLGRREQAEATYAALVKRLPDQGWGYIGWADQYWLYHEELKEYAQAEAIMQRALARPTLQDRGDVLDRLADLYGKSGRPSDQAATLAQAKRSTSALRPVLPPAASVAALPAAPAVRKLGRNDPCWCGSGRKYKTCHLDADRSKR